MKRRVAAPLGLCLALACGDRNAPAGPTPAAPPAEAAPKAATPFVPPAPPRSAAEVLELVPANAEPWLAIRDPFALLDGLEWASRGLREPWALLVRGGEPGPVGEVLAALPKIHTNLAGSGVHLERGVVLAQIAGHRVVVAAADGPQSLPALVRAMTGTELPLECGPLADRPGFQVCAADATARAAYRAVGTGAQLRDALATSLGADAVRDASALGEFAGVPLLATADDALLHVVFGLSEGDLGVPRVPTTMSELVPGSSLLCLNDDPRATIERVAEQLPDTELVVDAILATSGEWLLASPGGPLGLVLIGGAKNPALLRRLVKRAPELTRALQAMWPGTGVRTEPFDTNDGTDEVAIAEFELTDAQRAQLEEFEVQPRAMVLASDRWLVATLGLGDSAVHGLFRQPLAPVPPELLGALPAPMAASLGGGRSSFALHLEFDGLHAPDVRMNLVEAVGSAMLLHERERSAALLSLMSAVSTVSVWSHVEEDGTSGTLHLAVRAFGDAKTAEGQAAYTARLDVEETGSAAQTYGFLRGQYRDSDRARAYVARAGIGGISTAYPAVANLLMVDAFFRAARGSKRPALGTSRWLDPSRWLP